MRRGLAVSLAVVALAASVVVAHASSLSVNAGYLQALTVDAPEFQPPQDPDTYAVTVYVYFFHKTGKDWKSIPGQGGGTKSVDVQVDGSYTVDWTGVTIEDPSDCPSDWTPPSPVVPMEYGLGEFYPDASGDHVVCLLRSNWTGSEADADLLTVVATSSAPPAGLALVTESSTERGGDTEDASDLESGSSGAATVGAIRPDGIPDFVGENCSDGGWELLADADGAPYADEQACVDDQVRAYEAQQQDGS